MTSFAVYSVSAIVDRLQNINNLITLEHLTVIIAIQMTAALDFCTVDYWGNTISAFRLITLLPFIEALGDRTVITTVCIIAYNGENSELVSPWTTKET